MSKGKQTIQMIPEETWQSKTQRHEKHYNLSNHSSILQFLSAMTSGTLGEGLAGNPNDYAFSQTALDNIITQLMEQGG